MDPMTIVIVLALLATLGAMLLGILTMGAGGDTDAYVGERLMWARVGLQGLTVVLMIVALLLR